MLLKNNILFYINEIGTLDFKDWLFSESVFGEDVPVDNLRKWIRYMAVDYGEAHNVLKIKDKEYGNIFERLGWCNTSGSKMKIDCIYSVKTYINVFFRYYFDGKLPSYGYIMDYYDTLFSNEQLRAFANKNGIKESIINELFIELNKLAKNTHTIGNYMPYPPNVNKNNYNRIKGYEKGYVYFQDRIELLFKALSDNLYPDYIDEKCREAWKEWFNNNKEILFINNMLENKELLSYSCRTKTNKNGKVMLLMDNESDINNYLRYIKKVNELIQERGSSIQKSLNTIN